MFNIMEGAIEVHHVSLIKFIPFVVCKGHSRTIKLLTVQIHTFSICIHSLPCVAKYNREISRLTSGRQSGTFVNAGSSS